MDELVTRHVEQGSVGGAAWLVARRGEVAAGAAGVLTRGEPAPVERDSLFRISSMTKPIVAVAALVLVEHGRLALDRSVDDLLPELAGRPVLRDPTGPVDGPTEPARRPITLYDVLTYRMGYGFSFEGPWPQPFTEAMEERGLPWGAPVPQAAPGPDEWMRRLATLPLLDHPGARWRYNTPGDVLGVLVARAADAPLDEALRRLVLDPLGMDDTSFWTEEVDRLGTTYWVDGETGERTVNDPPAGQWSSRPAFCSGAGGLLSTVDDLRAFGAMLLARGLLPDGGRLLSADAVDAMTADHLAVVPGVPGPSSDGNQGWGLGVGVQVRRSGAAPAGSYGWAGGLGSAWWNDPAEGLVAVILTTDSFSGGDGSPGVIADFAAAVDEGGTG